MAELNVFYRICPNLSTKSPVFSDDKLALTMFSLRSFRKAFENIDYKITFILDSCPAIYREKINKLITADKTFFTGVEMGNRGSLLKQIELAALLENQDKVYLAEDDYIYLPGAGRKLVEALDVFDSVTLYDHPDYYQEPHKSYGGEVKIYAQHHWVSRISTCFSFGAKAEFIKENKRIITKYAPIDYQMWCDITKKSQLYSPIPSLATHLVAWLLAPNVNWRLYGI